MSNIKLTLAAFADEASGDLNGQIEAMKRNGLTHIEIRNVGKKNSVDLTPDEAKEIRKRLDAEGLKIRTIGSPFGKSRLTDDFTPELERFQRMTELAEILGAEKVRLFSFFREKGMEETKGREMALERLQKFVDRAGDLLLCHENEKGIYGDGWEFCKIICTEIPAIKAIFDPSNFIQCGVDTLEAWNELKDVVDYLHLKDARADGIVVPCGDGLGNVPYILGDFIDRGGRFATLEPHLANFASKKLLEKEEYKTCGYAYNDENDAFDAAVKAVKIIFEEKGVVVI
ncbi:MAG: sugar phosphate isomerase/epimerase [Clostridia bacterium]|nr:sugar phosphate isomerase/epimerase [Clostridia bacterium]